MQLHAVLSGASKPETAGEFKGPKPQYWYRSSGYKRIVQSNNGPFLVVSLLDAQIAGIKATIISTSPIAKLARILLYAYIAMAMMAVLATVHFLKSIQKMDSMLLILIALGVVSLGLYWCYVNFYRRYERLQEKVLQRNQSKFASQESDLKSAVIRCKSAEQVILSIWDAYCIEYSGYPPDWDERKMVVKTRDDFECTACGWPSGHTVRRRNLHVHHVTPLSAGGDNSLENLTTLCHICHRKQEGRGHKRIKYRKRE